MRYVRVCVCIYIYICVYIYIYIYIYARYHLRTKCSDQSQRGGIRPRKGDSFRSLSLSLFSFLLSVILSVSLAIVIARSDLIRVYAGSSGQKLKLFTRPRSRENEPATLILRSRTTGQRVCRYSRGCVCMCICTRIEIYLGEIG